MASEIVEYLRGKGVLSRITSIQSTRGQGGAEVLRLRGEQGAWVLKTGDPARQEHMHEYRFYAQSTSLSLPYLPKVRHAEIHPAFGLLLLMDGYEPLAHAAHDQQLHYRLAETCARLHFQDGPALARAMGIRHKPHGGDEAAARGYTAWCQLAVRHEGISLTELTRIYQRLPAMLEVLNRPPYQFVHGDLHPDNVLLDRQGQIVLCDWQSYSVGKGIGDMAFYAQRGRDHGIAVDEGQWMECYAGWAAHFYRKKLRPRDLLREKYAADLYALFLLWPAHLREAETARILPLYHQMLEAEQALLSHK